MPSLTHEDRIVRLEKVVHHLAESQVTLEDTVAEFVTETRKAFDQVAAHMRETDKRMRQTDERLRRTDERIDKLARRGEERSRKVDERVEKLVSAIGVFMRQDRN